MSFMYFAFVAQLVERSLGKTEVSGPIPDKGSRLAAQSAPTKLKPRYSSGQRGQSVKLLA